MTRPLPVLLVAAATLLLWHLGAYGLWESTEARYAEIAARMVRSGDWMTPRLNHIIHFDKPPLTYWATGIGLTVFGIDELGARIGLVVAALVVLTVTYRWAAETGPPAAAPYAFFCLLSAPLFFALARSVTSDMYLTMWVVLATDAARRATGPTRARGWRWLAWGAVGAGFLTKGPVVLLWTVAPALVWAALTNSWGRLRRLWDPIGVALALAIALPWYVVSAARHPQLIDFWLGLQTVGRVTSPYEGERAPVWFFLTTVVWAAGPWIIPATLQLARRRPRPNVPYVVVWAVFPLLIFSLFPTKRANYVLPVLPAVAMLAGSWWAAAKERPRARVVTRALGAVTLALGGGLLIAAFRAELPDPLRAVSLIAGPVSIGGGLMAIVAARWQRFDLAFAGCLAPLLVVYLTGYEALGDPRVEAFFKISRPLAVAATEHQVGDEPIVAFRAWPRAFPFYLNQRLITVTGEGRETRFEDDTSWRAYVFTDDDVFYSRFRDPRRALFVIRRREQERIAARTGVPVVTLAATRRYLLVTNRPTPSETPTSP
ncbi:MAG: glycosyltransferase family 39 protein [Gemmatimonadetes bacterium]|nr:glycosyltransferase family 39 protein [Gemmatimonadota bacterium]